VKKIILVLMALVLATGTVTAVVGCDSDTKTKK
jgi:hypothetical protein